MYQNTYCIDIGMLRLVHLGTEYGVSRGYLRAMQAEVFGGTPTRSSTTLIRVGEQLGIPAGEIRLSPPHGRPPRVGQDLVQAEGLLRGEQLSVT